MNRAQFKDTIIKGLKKELNGFIETYRTATTTKNSNTNKHTHN